MPRKSGRASGGWCAFLADNRAVAQLGPRLCRLFPANGYAPQEPSLVRGKIRAGVQRAAIVPHQQVARAPDVLVDELALLLVIEQLLQERIAFSPRQAFDLARHQTVDVKRLASR